ncbi:ADR239Wp [Eremothecium gossypii ATCC 10895]|uniref:ADR239Wp n=1 Tax=Eremothecium gossypii (strain ATCC 10895 / CBS 109.51 / FGSC 9923 / NRRL Y-1056) TaxID=284811 RepID=Q759N6_EREGS|nr:ADR239Wp [Eremothecium gossypii ATCC 10895]AAS52159.2 ADR239Wp [Eremothecium gossypii ATCC 10895]AEY96458.1 FADR239Wp [Eremothecium gossypii FDAG1]
MSHAATVAHTGSMAPIYTPLSTGRFDERRLKALRQKRPAWLLGLQYTLCVLIPLLVVLFALHDMRLRGLGDADRGWLLDTQRNYTMDRAYWRGQKQPCNRHYYFRVSKLVERAPDGIVRNLTVINGQYPGPLVEANAGDTLWLHVVNEMDDEPVTIHCHGLFFENQAYNDGAAHINQCPIPPGGGKYTYRIKVSEKQWGTYWYHSHFAAQQADGLFGPLVIHSSEEDMLLEEYDEDMVVMVNDYYHDMAATYMADYLAPGNENVEPTPDNGFIQGSGPFKYDSATYIVPHGSARNVSYVGDVAVPTLHLAPERKYRVRLINAGFFAPFNFAVDQHRLEVVEADGTVVDPVELESITMSVGQRYSFFLKREDHSSRDYLVRARFNPFCFEENTDNFDTDVHAILSYENDPGVPAPTGHGWPYDGGNTHCADTNQTMFRTRGAKVPRRSDGLNRPDIFLTLDVSFLIKERQLDRGYFNKHTYKPLGNSCTMHELAFEPDANPIRKLHTESDLETVNQGQYLINLDKRGSIVDIVINNYDDGAHPFHMHGHKFWVLRDSLNGYFHDNYYEDSASLNFENPVLRDTINVSGYGYAVIRFVVDNPGIWPFHCHIGWHMAAGLLLQINALQAEYTEWTDYPATWSSHCRLPGNA